MARSEYSRPQAQRSGDANVSARNAYRWLPMAKTESSRPKAPQDTPALLRARKSLRCWLSRATVPSSRPSSAVAACPPHAQSSSLQHDCRL